MQETVLRQRDGYLVPHLMNRYRIMLDGEMQLQGPIQSEPVEDTGSIWVGKMASQSKNFLESKRKLKQTL